MRYLTKLSAALALLAAACFGPAVHTDACSRILYKGADSLFVVARSLDWKTPIPTNLYVYPRGMQKRSSDQPDCLQWKSKYGAVYAVGYDGGVTEGMNECGLVINGLFCKGTIYNAPDNNSRPQMSLSVFVAWMLDQCRTVDEVAHLLENTRFDIQGATFDGGTVSALHWGATDASGKSVIFEFDHGNVNIYDMGNYRAMTNDPTWPRMTAIIDYWEKIGGMHMLPGTVVSADRCVRGNYFAHHVKQVGDGQLGVSIARSLLMNTSVPYTYEIEGQPELSSTQWRSYANLRDCRYYFDIVTNPGYFYVDLKNLDLKQGAPVLKLDTSRTSDLVGNANSRLAKSKPFKPMW